jgi:anti-anti-sigma factor
MDAAAMKTQRPVFEELADCGQDVVIDMSDVEFIDSSGVGAIVFLYKRMLASKRTLKLQKLNGQPHQLLTYLRLADLVKQ